MDLPRNHPGPVPVLRVPLRRVRLHSDRPAGLVVTPGHAVPPPKLSKTSELVLADARAARARAEQATSPAASASPGAGGRAHGSVTPLTSPHQSAPTPDEPMTDLGTARRLVAEHGDRFRYVPAWRRWLVWDGRRWAPDETEEIVRAAKATARGLLHVAADEDDRQRRRDRVRAAERAESATGLRAMVELAGTEPGIVVRTGDLDADPYLLNTTTGVLDLRTGTVGPHDPALHLTKTTAAGYDPAASAATFDAFLRRVQPDPEMREFLARLLGYGLLGGVTEHVLPVFYGTGANGKSTLIDAITAALGDYAGTADPGLLIDRGDVHPTGMADLHARRLVVTHETDAGRRLAEGTVKRLTGGDRIKARRMREDFWEFDPSHLILMVTNHRPLVRGTDEGIWRRLRLVPFDVVIPAAQRDSALPERLALEADGVLGWLVAGHAAWRAQGLGEPAPVSAATAAYRADSDALGRFLAEHTVNGAQYTAPSSALFDAWKRHCAGENLEAGTQTAFGRSLVDRGFENTKRRGRMVWLGLGFHADDEEAE